MEIRNGWKLDSLLEYSGLTVFKASHGITFVCGNLNGPWVVNPTCVVFYVWRVRLQRDMPVLSINEHVSEVPLFYFHACEVRKMGPIFNMTYLTVLYDNIFFLYCYCLTYFFLSPRIIFAKMFGEGEELNLIAISLTFLSRPLCRQSCPVQRSNSSSQRPESTRS